MRYNYWLDGIKPCRIIPHEHISPKYCLIEFPTGIRTEVEFRRVKNNPVQLKPRSKSKQHRPIISDIYCDGCGELGSNPNKCEHCGNVIT